MPLKGYKQTEEHKKKMSLALKRNLNGFKKGNDWRFKRGENGWQDRKHTEETKKKMSEIHKRIGTGKGNKGKHWKLSEKTKEKMKGRVKEKSGNWQGGISFEPYSVDWTETLKRSIRERDNYICQFCSQYGNNVHHKDYNKANCNPDNLITLCPKCHSKTNHNRKYWISYFKSRLK